ncbi:unnamed protein product [Mycena citricolor]|uniref:Gpr1 family protein n=1 Tax=Mycena citricolor TaxID=2018698 RepID=A0AAD2H3S4_9AGAR|nr:unnamed protein product [Mycena citricolor]CAK5269287.1 unnamed protein product [Mycena citricolor]
MSDIEKGSAGTVSAPASVVHQAAVAPATAAPPQTIASAGALGLFSFASTVLIFCLYFIGTDGIQSTNVVVGMSLFCGGLAQFIAGMWEFPRNNAFAGTAFASYGAFWLSFSTIFIPGSGILEAYGNNVDELNHALGLYLFSWFIVSFLFLVVTLRKSVAFILLFFLAMMTFLLLAITKFLPGPGVTKAFGAFGISLAFVAYYIGLADLLAAEPNPLFTLPLGIF